MLSMKVVVTGGAGFIGSHLSVALQQAGHHVTVIDDLNDYYSPRLKGQNLEEVLAEGSSQFFRGDIRDSAFLDDIFAVVRPDAVFHLAARAGVRPSLQEPQLYASVNIAGTLAVLEAARKTDVGHMVFASSSSVYGEAPHSPFRESDCVNRPISPYAATKIAGEQLCHTYSHLYGMKIHCLRLFTVYGPRQRPDLAIYKFAEAIDEGRPVSLYGDGLSGRDYTHVSDVVRGMLGTLGCDTTFDVFNLGSQRSISTLQMVRELEAALGREAIIDWYPKQPGDVSLTLADISHAGEMLGYAPQVSFGDGIRDFVRWHKELDVKLAA